MVRYRRAYVPPSVEFGCLAQEKKEDIGCQTGVVWIVMNAATIEVRAFQPEDAGEVNRIALAAWDEYRNLFSDWPRTRSFFAASASRAAEMDLLIATAASRIVGLVGYVAPGRKREDFFPADWALMRLLSVDPAERGQGIGRRLSEECIARARRERASIIGLHTSPALTIALPMYLRLGFVHYRDIPDRNGLPYATYALQLDSNP